MSVREGGWKPFPERPKLGGDEVHAVSASLDLARRRLEVLGSVLSADEHARAARFRFESDRNRFVAARGALRCILGSYLGVEPQRIVFRYGSRGKPSLAPEPAGDGLSFNVSHSRDLALIALARGRELGVDVEFEKPLVDAERIAERFFSPREAAALRAMPSAEKPAAFFACWTRKEAYVKATGDGLSRPLDAFDVSVLPGRAARLDRVEGDPAEARRWSLADLRPAPGYSAALAVAGRIEGLSCWEWLPADVVMGAAPPAGPGRSNELEGR